MLGKKANPLSSCIDPVVIARITITVALFDIGHQQGVSVISTANALVAVLSFITSTVMSLDDIRNLTHSFGRHHVIKATIKHVIMSLRQVATAKNSEICTATRTIRIPSRPLQSQFWARCLVGFGACTTIAIPKSLILVQRHLSSCQLCQS